MKIGRLPENVYDRSVYRIVHKYNKDLTKGIAPSRDCAFLCAKGWDLSNNKNLWSREFVMLLAECVAEAAVAGKPATMQAKIVISQSIEEPDIRELMQALTCAAGVFELYLDKVDIRTGAGISNAQISLLLCGTRENDRTYESEQDGVGEIIMIGTAGSSGASYLAARYEDRLLERYSREYVSGMKKADLIMSDGFDGIRYYLDLAKFLEGRCRYICSASDGAIYTMGEGGVYAALWELGKALNCGMRVELKAIPVFQETIETCDFFDVNPYMMYSGGCMLVVTSDPKTVCGSLTDAGYEAANIGHLTKENARVIINNDEERFLTAPAQDELFKAIEISEQ